MFKLISKQGVWQDLLRTKYLHNKSITQVDKKQGDSHFWSGLIKAKGTFLNMGSWIVNNGEQTRFWEDKWLSNLAFKDKYPYLYATVRRKNSSIATVMGSVPLNVSFRRALVGQNLVFCHDLCASIIHIQLNQSSDCVSWNYNQNSRFCVRSMYLALINNGYIERNKIIWKLKMPLKIKIFMWYLLKGMVLMKDNLARQNWNSCLRYCLCMKNETINYLFIDCHYAKFIWRAVQFSFDLYITTSVSPIFYGWLLRVDKKKSKLIMLGAFAICWALWLCSNDMVFDKSPSVSYMQAIFRATYRFRFWAQLQRSDEVAFKSSIIELLKVACRKLESMVMQLFANYG